MVAMQEAEPLENGLGCDMSECGRRIHQAAIEEDPAGSIAGVLPVGQRNLDGALREGCEVDPRKGCSAICARLLHDAPARLIDRCVSPATKLGQQCRFSAARASGQNDEAIAHSAVPRTSKDHASQTSMSLNIPARSAPERNDGSERDRRGVVGGKLVIARRNAAEVLQTAERGLDAPALPVAPPVVANLPLAGECRGSPAGCLCL